MQAAAKQDIIMFLFIMVFNAIIMLCYIISFILLKEIVVAEDCRRARRARWQLAEAQQF